MAVDLPTSASLTGAGTTKAQQKLNLAALRDFMANLLGTDSSDKPAARTALGVAPRATRIDVASVAGTVDLTASAPNTDDIRITGDLDITKFTVAVGRVLRVTAGGKFTLAHNANIVTPFGQTLSFSDKEAFELRATAADVVEIMGVNAIAVIERQTTAAAATSVDFTTIYNAAFDSYELKIERLLPTTNNSNLLLQFQVAGAWVTSGYYWASWRWTTAGSGVVGQGGTGTGIALNAAGADNMANVGSPAGFVVRISNCAQATAIKRVNCEGVYVGSTTINLRGNGESAGTGAVTGFRVIQDVGTLQAGAVLTLRGMR